VTRLPSSPFEHTCDCRCPAHYGRHRLAYNDPGCHCRITCASQPATLLTPHAALFLNYHGDMWSVPRLASDRFDWRHATPVLADSDPAVDTFAQLLHHEAYQLRQHVS